MTSGTLTASRQEFSRSDEGPIAGGGTSYLFACILLAAGGSYAFAAWQRVPALRLTCLAIAAACALPLAFLIFRAIRLLQKIGRAVLVTPYESLALGHATTATYFRPLRGGAALESVDVRLQCEEHLQKGSGKNNRHLIKVVRDEHLKAVMLSSPNELRLQVPLRIPENGPPSIKESRAEIRWVVRMRLKMRGCRNTRSSFVINVLPAMVKR